MNRIMLAGLVCSTWLLVGCVTTDDPYEQPFSTGYTGYTIGMGPSYWGSGYAPNPGYDYGFGNSSLVYLGGSRYYGAGYYPYAYRGYRGWHGGGYRGWHGGGYRGWHGGGYRHHR